MSAPRHPDRRGARPLTAEQLAAITGDRAAIQSGVRAAPPLVCHETRTINLSARRLAASLAWAMALTALVALIMAVTP